MKMTLKIAAVAAILLGSVHTSAIAQNASPVRDHILGKKDAPITVIEYASFTCSHCATFYAEIMPELEKRYIETGKVKFIFRNFPMDAFGLKAATISHCMPEEQFYPFVKILFKNYATWTHAPKPEETLMQYAQMAGLTPEKAKSCTEDTKLMDAIIEVRTQATDKYNITATPTFLINDGAEKIVGARKLDDFVKVFDKLLAEKK